MTDFASRVAPALRAALPRSLTAHLPSGPLTGLRIRELDAALASTSAAVTEPNGPVETAEFAGVPVRIHRPQSPTGSDPVLIWFHGGGMVMGSAAGSDGRARSRMPRHAALSCPSTGLHRNTQLPLPTRTVWQSHDGWRPMQNQSGWTSTESLWEGSARAEISH